jgi:uncharacterized protein
MEHKVSDKEALMQVLADHADRIYSYGVESLFLFGSFKRNENIGDDSDIDFLVDFKPGQKSLTNLVDLGHYIEKLTSRRVELVTREGLSKHINPYILNAFIFLVNGYNCSFL